MDSEPEFEKSEDSPELDKIVSRVDDSTTEVSEDEIGRSGDEDTNTRSSKRQLSNLRSSEIISSTETQTAKAYVPLKI